MNPVLQSCDFLLQCIRTLIAGVRHFGYESLGTDVPKYAPTKAAAQRLAAGLKLAEAYLRRLLIIMALKLEPTLVDTPQGDLSKRRREKIRKIALRRPTFAVFEKHAAMPEATLDKMRQDADDKRTPNALRGLSKPVFIGMLKARLDNLAKIAAAPIPRATRLAFYLARKRPGPICAAGRHVKPSNAIGSMRQLWGTETSATFTAMAMSIRTLSEARPPPLPKRLKYGPSITVLDW